MIGASLSLIAAAGSGAFEYQAPQAPARASGWALWGQVFYFLLVFCIVIGLTYLVTRALANRTRSARHSAHLRVIDELPLGMGRSVLLIDCVDKILVVGSAERSLSPLGQIDEPTVVAQLRESHGPDDMTHTDFGAILQQALRPNRSPSGPELSPLADAERNAQGLRDLTQRFRKQRTD